MLALKRCIMTLCLDLSLTWNKLSSCILNIWGCSVSAPLSESHTHGSSDTFQTLLILITESIEFYCGDSGPDFEPCWWDRYIRCIQDVSSVTVNISTQESGEFSQQHNVIILATLWESEQKKRSQRHGLNFQTDTSLLISFGYSIPLWTSCLKLDRRHITRHWQRENNNRLQTTSNISVPTVVMCISCKPENRINAATTETREGLKMHKPLKLLCTDIY